MTESLRTPAQTIKDLKQKGYNVKKQVVTGTSNRLNYKCIAILAQKSNGETVMIMTKRCKANSKYPKITLTEMTKMEEPRKEIDQKFLKEHDLEPVKQTGGYNNEDEEDYNDEEGGDYEEEVPEEEYEEHLFILKLYCSYCIFCHR